MIPLCLRTLEQKAKQRTARRLAGLKAIPSMGAASRARFKTVAAFSQKAARSWRYILALLGYNQASELHQALNFQRSLAKAGIIDKTTFRFTSIAQGLADLWQDPSSSRAGSVLAEWTVNLRQSDGSNGTRQMTYNQLQEALALVR